jgi:hypothetical protein
MENAIGYVIPGLIAISLVLAWYLINRQWRETWEPHEYYRDVGIHYAPGVVRPWKGMEPAIDAIYEVLEKSPEYAKAYRVPFYLICYPYAADLITLRNPTGYIDQTTGMPAAKPKTEAEAAKVYRVAGTGTALKKWPWSKPIPAILIKEMRKDDTAVQGRLSTGLGSRLGVGWSALHHEHAHHLVSELVYEDENLKHARGDLEVLMEKYRAVYNVRFPEEKA